MEDTNFLVVFFITIPIIATYLFYKIGMKVYAQDWRAFHFAVHMSSIFYIIAVNMLFFLIFRFQFVGSTFVVMLVILTIILIVQRRKNTEVILWKGVKAMWRITFLLFFTLYICAIIYTLLQVVFFKG